MKNKSYSKMVAIFALVLVTITSLWFALPATPCHAQGGYAEVSGGAAGGGGFPEGYTSLGDKTDSKGVFAADATAKTSDGLCQLTINKGTTALNSTGYRLTSILMSKMTSPPAPPAQANAIGLTYDLGPEGATFSPPITITFTYDPTKIPAGVNEKNLVLAFYDKSTTPAQWVKLTDIAVNMVTHTISGKTSHFSAFTIIAYTRPAAFTASALTISPAQVNPGEKVSISATISNTGDLSGTHDVILKINDAAIETKQVTIAGYASQTITFTTTMDVAGTHTVNVDGLTGTFTVKAPVPAPLPTPPVTPPAPAPTPTPPVTPPAPAPTPTPIPTTPTPTPTPATPINWWLIGGIIVVVIIIAIAVWMLVARRRARA